MIDILHTLSTLRRPQLLIRAARIGAAEYRRESHLRRHLGYGPLPRSGAALGDLLEMEAALEHQRREQTAGYCPSRHVDVLIAMMGEARLLRATAPQPVT